MYVNGEKFLTLLCSPMKLEALVVGYLWMEKVIGTLDEITRARRSRRWTAAPRSRSRTR